jgi:hypothetical protein
LADGEYYYEEINYSPNTLILGSFGSRPLLEKGTFRVGEVPSAVINTKASKIKTFANGNTFTVKGITAGARIMIADLTGRIITNTISTSDVFTKSLTPAIYIIKVVSGNDVLRTKVIVK